MSAAVPASELQQPRVSCPVCNQAAGQRVLQALQRSPDVNLVECGRCGSASADRLPTDDYLTSLYDPTLYSSSLVSDRRLSDRCARNIVAEVSFAPDEDVSIVDYGGADGTLSRCVRERLLSAGHMGRVTATVVDLFPGDASEHQRFTTPDDFASSSDTYNLLIASAVLEHLPTPHAALSALLSHAAPGAYLYGRTPYDAPLARVVPGYQVKWPHHLHDLGPAFWDRFVELFDIDGDLLVSRPSIVETSLRQSPLRTILAHVLKAPGHVESALVRPAIGYASRYWRWVGGWEVVVAWRRG